MKQLLLDVHTTLRSPIPNYSQITNIVRINDYNVKKMFDRIADLNYNLRNQNVLVGLLQNLSLDPNWTFDYVVAYTRLRARSLCSAFGIATPHNKGALHPDTLFYGGCKELFCLLESNTVPTIESYSSSKSIIPIYSTITTWGYNPTAERERVQQNDYRNDIALVGIDLVNLAVGWWVFMRNPINAERGIHHYLASYVMPYFELLHNQLAIFNSIYEHIVYRIGYNNLLKQESVDFNTLAIRDDLLKLLSFITIGLKSNTWRHHSVLTQFLTTKLTPDLRSLFDATLYDLGYNENVVWMFELNAVKYFILYFSIVNELSIESDMMRGQLQQLTKLIQNRWERIKEPFIKQHALDQLLKLKNLLDQ